MGEIDLSFRDDESNDGIDESNDGIDESNDDIRSLEEIIGKQ
jgi:hypothetical protein